LLVDHARDDRRGALPCPEQVDLEHSADFVCGDGGGVLIAVGDAGVIDQDVDALQTGNGLGVRARIGDIDPGAGECQPLAALFVCGVAGPAFVSGGQHDVDPLGGELPGDLSAEPSVRTGYQCDSLLIRHEPKAGR
jgi:hypothetical protein